VTVTAFGRIRRGTMAAGRFTRIANHLFRDQRLSFKAKGIFGLLAGHRDGYGITPLGHPLHQPRQGHLGRATAQRLADDALRSIGRPEPVVRSSTLP
jgi:hypothetical protein